jgi:hypothetical protein
MNNSDSFDNFVNFDNFDEINSEEQSMFLNLNIRNRR